MWRPEVEGDQWPRWRVIISKHQKIYLPSGIYQQSLGQGMKPLRTAVLGLAPGTLMPGLQRAVANDAQA